MAFIASCSLLFLGLSGCGKQLPSGKTKIIGTVTVDDEPLIFSGEGFLQSASSPKRAQRLQVIGLKKVMVGLSLFSVLVTT